MCTVLYRPSKANFPSKISQVIGVHLSRNGSIHVRRKEVREHPLYKVSRPFGHPECKHTEKMDASQAAAIAEEHLEHLVEYGLVKCRECPYAVWPSNIAGHLHGKHHRMKRGTAEAIAEAVQSWPGLVQYPSEFEVPKSIDRPIPQLPLYNDGLLCQLRPECCEYICRGMMTMKKHWHEAHQWSVRDGRRGGSGRTKKQRMGVQLEGAYSTIHCQQFFPKLHCSQYFRVHRAEEVQEKQAWSIPEGLWGRIQQQARHSWQEAVKERQEEVKEDKPSDANQWLNRAGWAKYLKKLKRTDLLAMVEEPDGVGSGSKSEKQSREDDDAIQTREEIAAVIWKAMKDVARASQTSVMHRIGIFIRMEAIRTEKHQTRFQPLQTYMDEDSVDSHVQPWQQVLMFFVRTQAENDWESPEYQFTQQQTDAFRRLIEEAEQVVRGEGEGDREDEIEEEEDEIEEEEQDEEEQGGYNRVDNKGDNKKPKPLSRLQRACLDFCIELLNQTVTTHEYDSALVCALAVLGVTENGWKGVDRYPQVLSSMIKIARFMVIQKALEITKPSDNNHFNSNSVCDFSNSSDESDIGQEPQRRRQKGCLRWVGEMMDGFMVRGSNSPMQWMLDLRTYGMKIQLNTTATGHVGWNGKDELLYKSAQFTMPQFRAMVQGLVETAGGLMDELLFCGERYGKEAPVVPWHSLRDDPTNEKAGFNFLQDQRTRMPVDGMKWLFDQIGRDKSVQKQFVRPGSESGVKRKGVEEWMRKVIELQAKLLVLMHVTGGLREMFHSRDWPATLITITGGQPARGTEILGIRHTNTAEGHRNIFIEDGMVVYVTRYHKGYQLKGDVKVIHRYLPREVGELVVRYIWLLLPFQEQMEALLWGKPRDREYMWSEDVDGKQWTSERMRKVLKEATAIRLGCELTIQAYREIAIGISRRFMRGKAVFRDDEGEDDADRFDPDSIAKEIADAQAGHTSHVAGLIYARLIMEQSGVMADRREWFRASSTDWHEFLGFQAAVRGGGPFAPLLAKRKNPFQEEMEEEKLQRWKRVRRMDAAGKMQELLGKQAQFRSVQERGIKAIQSGTSPVVAIMPTSAGKSLLFMLPAFAEPGGLTVVVVPLKSLRADMMRRCDEKGIKCVVWNARRPADAASIVLVTPEQAVGDKFGTFLNRMKMTRRLDRIVVDECHVMFNKGLGFRKELQQMGKLMMAEAQIVLLTATLPPSKEEELWGKLGWGEKPLVIRDKTVRRNIRYRVVDVRRLMAGRNGWKAVREKENELLEEMVDGVLRKSTGK